MIPRVASLALSLVLVVALSLAPAARAAAEDDPLTGETEGFAAAGSVVAPATPDAPAAPTAAPPAGKRTGGKRAGVKAPGDKGPGALDGDEVLVTAEHLERSTLERVVIGEGAVTIRHRDMRLVADRVVYNELTKEVVADGNVVLDSGADRLQGEHLELNLDTRIGFLEHAQGFLQTYYFTGERIEKRGPDHYFLRGGTFTTCEGVLPDWSFHATSAEVTIEEYLHAWNPTLRIKKLPVLYFPYAIFPVKRERSTGLLIPVIGLGGVDGLTVRNAFYWAPRDNFDATIGIDYLQKTGWGASAEARYLLARRTQGIMSVYFQKNTGTEAERWSLTTRNSQELPLGLHAEIEAFFQSDREFISTRGATIEERSNERTTSSFVINRDWSAWNFELSGRREESMITEKSTTLTRFPELTIARTSTRLFGTDLFLKLTANGVGLSRDDSTTTVETTRLHLSPEMTWPFSIASVARIIPVAGYAWTRYSENTLGAEETRALPFFKVGLEGPRPYRIWDLSGDGRFTKLKHLLEPRISYVYTPSVNQDSLPQFDSLDRILPANRVEYSLSNTLYAKVRAVAVPGQAAAPVAPAPPGNALLPPAAPVAASSQVTSPAAEPAAGPTAAPSLAAPAEAGPETAPPLKPEPATAGASGEAAPPPPAPQDQPGQPGQPGQPELAGQLTTTQELLWIKLSQNYLLDNSTETDEGQPFSAVEWEARTRPLTGLEITWRGNYDVYGKGLGYQNLSLNWRILGRSSLQGDWRSTRDSNQDFLDLGGNLALGRIDIVGRSRYNLTEKTFVENRISVKYVSQCWDVTLGYVRWTDTYEYSLLFSLKGIGTIVRI